jgi:hypothetical protein
MKSRLLLVSFFIAAVCWLKFAASTPIPDPWCVSGLKTLESGQEQTKEKPVARKMKLMRLTPVIEQVLPQEPDGKPTAYPGDLLTITGRNFAPDTNVTRVVLMQRVEPPPAMPPSASLVIDELYMKSATPEKLEAMIPLTVQPGEYMICVRVGTLAYSAPVALSVRTKVALPTGPIPVIFSVYQALPGMVATIHGSGFGPKTVVRFKSAMSSQDAEFIDASTVRVRVPPELKPGPSELQVEVNYLPSAWFPIELQRPMPLSLYWNDTDDNGSPINPKWGWQVEHSYGTPDYYPVPHELVPTTATPFGPMPLYTPEGLATATDWPVGFDDGGWRHAWCGPHVNWMPATYVGLIKFSDHATDDDYCYWLFPEEGAGATFRTDDNIGGIMVEHDSDETIDHFCTTWWDLFHQRVDQGEGTTRMINDDLAIVTGLVGLDCQHDCQSELHPVWLMAIRVKQQGQDETWAMFARNWGNEGWCGVNQHYIWFPEDGGMYRAEMLLPRPGATSVQVVDEETEFKTSPHAPADGPYVTLEKGRGARVTWWLPHPDERGWSEGTLKLRWTDGSLPLSLTTATVLAAKATGAKFDEEAEVIAQMRAALPDHARPVFAQQISAELKKSPPVAGVQPPRRTRDASRAIKPQQPPASTAQPDPVELERTRQMERAMAEVGVTAMPRATAVKTTVTRDLTVRSSILRTAVPLDISGTWRSNIGLTYELRQSGGRFTWTVDSSDETAEGTLDGQALSVSWTSPGGGTNTATGKITATDAKGRAIRIEWDNGVVFLR